MGSLRAAFKLRRIQVIKQQSESFDLTMLKPADTTESMDWLSSPVAGSEVEIDTESFTAAVEDPALDFNTEDSKYTSSSTQRSTSKTKGSKVIRRGALPIFQRPILGIDSEWVLSPCGTFNKILSWQFHLRHNGKSCSKVIYPASTSKTGRLQFDKFIADAVEFAISEGVLEKWPSDLIVCGHFIKADLLTFNNAFANLKNHIHSLRNSVSSLGDNYGVDLEAVYQQRVDKEPIKIWDRNRNPKTLFIIYYDTMFFAPSGKTLDDVGELVGVNKLKIDAPYSIERMDEYLEGDKSNLEAYAIRDAEISCLHMARVIQFCKTLNLRSVPYTIGGIATRSFIQSLGDTDRYRELFAYEKITKVIWPEQKANPLTITRNIANRVSKLSKDFAADCYHGARNESFFTGPTNTGTWYDYDAPSCYPVVLASIRKLDYLKTVISHNVEDYFGDVFGIAWVRFSFCPSTRFPSLPVRTSSDMLCYPLNGESYCTAAEIEVAARQGATLEIIYGNVIPWLDDDCFFTPFMGWAREQRNALEEGCFEERLLKEIANTVYGKVAQAVRPKSGFDLQVGFNKEMPPSLITHAHYAAHTTGGARALMSEMLNAIPEKYTVISVTTDGFLTDAPLSEINLTGPICNRFRELYHKIEPDGGEILKEKHRVKQLLSMKTRGQATLIPADGYKPVLAKAGVKTPKGTTDQNAYIVDLYFNRTAETKVDSSHLTSTREQFLQQKDLMMEKKQSRLNLEPDLKRKLLAPKLITFNDIEHIASGSVPYNSVEDMEFERVCFARWRLQRCLKTLNDWDHWIDYIAMHHARRSYNARRRDPNMAVVKIKINEQSDQFFKRLFLRVYAQGELGLEGGKLNLKELAEWLTESGYETKPATVRSAKRLKLAVGVIPVTTQSIKLLRLIMTKFPQFKYESMFNPDSLEELRSSMHYAN